MHTKYSLVFFFICTSTSFFLSTHAISIFNEQTYADAQRTLGVLTLEQKIGQLFVVASVIDPTSNDVLMQQIPYRTEQTYIEKLITEYHIGGIIFLGTARPEQQIEITNHYQALAKKVGSLPLLIAQDLEWGLSMRLKNTVRYPHNMAIGAINDTRETSEQNSHSTTQKINPQSSTNLIYEMGKEIGRQAKLLGVHMNLAPVMDVNNNPKNPIINDRSFGAHPATVARKAYAYMHGLHDAGVLSCAKHFPGHGDTSVDSHHNLPCITHDKKQLNEIELVPFKAAIAANIPAIMIAHLQIPAYEKEPHTPATLSRKIATELLKQELGFSGLVITDGLGMQGVLNSFAPGDLELQALLAGNDMLLCPMDVPKATKLIKQALASGKLSKTELDAHVLKILQAKNWAFAQRETPEPGAVDLTQLHTAHAYALKRKLYRAAITLVRDTAKHIPLTQYLGVDALTKNLYTNLPSRKIHTQATPSTTIKNMLVKEKATIAYVQIGNTAENRFAQTLDQKLSLAQYHLAKTENGAELLTTLADEKVIIVSMHEMSRLPQERFGITDNALHFITTLTNQRQQVILVLFGNAYSVKLFENVSTLIVAYEDDPDAQVAAAEIITGELKATASLPI